MKTTFINTILGQIPLSLIAILAAQLVSTPSVLGIDYKDAPRLEPYPLTPELVETLTAPAEGSDSAEDRLVLAGFTLSVKNVSDAFLGLEATSDRRLNLWRGRPNDLRSGHMGRAELELTEVRDIEGQDRLDRSREDSVGRQRLGMYHLGEETQFWGSKSFRLLEGAPVARITGTLYLTLPVDIARYEILRDRRETLRELEKLETISEAKFQNGISLLHPEKLSSFPMCVQAFDAAGERLSIGSTGSAGRGMSHWAFCSDDVECEKILLFLPGTLIEREIPFSLVIENQ